jgi:hypothetical protein
MFREYLHHTYQALIRRRKARSRRVHRTNRPAAARLAIEDLEARTLLSTLTLSGGALVYVPSTSANNTLTISDNPATHRYTFVDTAEVITLVGSFTNPSGNLTHTVSFGDGNIISIAVNMGNQSFNVNIEQTLAGAPVTVNMGAGTDTVNVSPVAHNLDNIRGPITLHAGVGIDSLNVYDNSNPHDQAYTLDAGAVSRSFAGTITYGSGINFVTINASNGNDLDTVNGTEVGFATTLNTGAGHSTVWVNGAGFGGTFTLNEGTGGNDVFLGANHNLDNLRGTLHVNGNHLGVDNLTVDDQSNSASQTFTLDSHSITRTGAGLIQYNLQDSVTVQTGFGAPTVNVLSTSTPVMLTGDSPNTTVNIGNAGTVQQILGPLTINNPPSHSIVNVDDSADTTTRTVSLDTVTMLHGRITGLAPAAITYTYFDTNNITIQTGTGGATVNVLATGTPVNLIGHSLNTTINVGDAGSVQQILGPLTITNPPSYTTVNVDDSADGAARTVSQDTVSIGGVDYGRITGLAPAAILYKYPDTSSVAIQTGTGGATVNLLAIGKPINVIGNPSAPISLFSAGANIWAITGHNAGTLTTYPFVGPVTFSGTANLLGGNGDDAFVFVDGGSVDGTIDGGGGTNTLDYSNGFSGNVIVDLQTGFATGVGGGIANIQNVAGGSGGGAGVYNVLVGNGGNVLTGGDGRRNLLIAGASASTLIGGNDDDILIGGTTAYDTEAGLVSLQAIMNYWCSTTDDYATRVANLLTGNGVPLLDATMVTNNGGGNTMMGNHGGMGEMNLFYGSASDVTDQNPGTGEQFVNC